MCAGRWVGDPPGAGEIGHLHERSGLAPQVQWLVLTKVNHFPGWCFFRFLFLKFLFQSNPRLVYHAASQGTQKQGWKAWEGKRRAAGGSAGVGDG